MDVKKMTRLSTWRASKGAVFEGLWTMWTTTTSSIDEMKILYTVGVYNVETQRLQLRCPHVHNVHKPRALSPRLGNSLFSLRVFSLCPHCPHITPAPELGGHCGQSADQLSTLSTLACGCAAWALGLVVHIAHGNSGFRFRPPGRALGPAGPAAEGLQTIYFYF